MATVYLGLGSNLDPADNLRLAIREIGSRFTLLRASPVYRNQAVGFSGEDFLNAVVCVTTDLNPVKVCAELDCIHKAAGRLRGQQKFASRTLDIDLLMYDDLIEERRPVVVPRDDILNYSFVLRPLADIAPDLQHPVTGRTMYQHWQAFDQSSHPLQRDPLKL